jgi:hypothetical protein
LSSIPQRRGSHAARLAARMQSWPAGRLPRRLVVAVTGVDGLVAGHVRLQYELHIRHLLFHLVHSRMRLWNYFFYSFVGLHNNPSLSWALQNEHILAQGMLDMRCKLSDRGIYLRQSRESIILQDMQQG